MVSLSESFRRLCYIGSYPRQTETIGWTPQKKSGVDCTNEWYLGGVFVYIGSYSLLCLQELYQISANHRVNLIWLHRYYDNGYIPCHYAVEWKNYLYILGIWILWSFNSSESSVKMPHFACYILILVMCIGSWNLWTISWSVRINTPWPNRLVGVTKFSVDR